MISAPIRSARKQRALSQSRRSRTRSTKTAASKLVLVTFPELNQAFDAGERLTLPLPISFDPVKGVDLIFQLPWRKLSRGCVFFGGMRIILLNVLKI